MGARSKLLLGLLAAVLVMATLAVFLRVERAGAFGKVPRGFVRAGAFELEEGVEGIQFTGEGTPEEAVAAFRAQLERAGWQTLSSAGEDGFAVAVLGRGDRQAAILATATGPGEVAVSVLAGPARTEEVKTPAVPDSDVDGGDPLPRLPGSVRARYESFPGVTAVEYLTPSTAGEVLVFFAAALPEDGWTLEGMGTAGRAGSCADEGDSRLVTATHREHGLVQVTVEASPDHPDHTLVEVLLFAW